MDKDFQIKIGVKLDTKSVDALYKDIKKNYEWVEKKVQNPRSKTFKRIQDTFNRINTSSLNKIKSPDSLKNLSKKLNSISNILAPQTSFKSFQRIKDINKDINEKIKKRLTDISNNRQQDLDSLSKGLKYYAKNKVNKDIPNLKTKEDKFKSLSKSLEDFKNSDKGEKVKSALKLQELYNPKGEVNSFLKDNYKELIKTFKNYDKETSKKIKLEEEEKRKRLKEEETNKKKILKDEEKERKNIEKQDSKLFKEREKHNEEQFKEDKKARKIKLMENKLDLNVMGKRLGAVKKILNIQERLQKQQEKGGSGIGDAVFSIFSRYLAPLYLLRKVIQGVSNSMSKATSALQTSYTVGMTPVEIENMRRAEKINLVPEGTNVNQRKTVEEQMGEAQLGHGQRNAWTMAGVDLRTDSYEEAIEKYKEWAKNRFGENSILYRMSLSKVGINPMTDMMKKELPNNLKATEEQMRNLAELSIKTEVAKLHVTNAFFNVGEKINKITDFYANPLLGSVRQKQLLQEKLDKKEITQEIYDKYINKINIEQQKYYEDWLKKQHSGENISNITNVTVNNYSKNEIDSNVEVENKGNEVQKEFNKVKE